MSQRTRSFGVLALVLWGLGAWAQPTYLLRPHREVPIGISVAGMGAFNLWAAPAVKGYTLAELDALEPTHIPAWDQWALGRWNEGAGHRSDYLFYGAALWSSATVLLPALNEGEWQASLPTAVMWVEMNALTLVATDLTKNLVTRPRPFTYYSDAPLEARLEVDARKSFFSGHTSMTAANTFYAAKVFSDLYPDSKMKPWVWAAAAVIPALTAQQRMAAGKHFLSDVVVGYAVGALIGWGIPQWHLQR